MINFSVIIPVGPGHEDLFIDAVKSVQIQEKVSYEIIVVDDTGSDSHLYGFISDKEDVRVFETDARNVSVARNLGASKSRGECLVFLDADDLLVPGALLAMYTVYREDGGIVYGNVIRSDTGETFNSPTQDCKNVRTSALFKPKRMPTHLIPRNIFLQSNGFDPDVAYFEDIDFECYMDYVVGACATKIEYPIYYYRLHTGTRRSYTESDDEETKKIKQQLRNKYDKYIRGDLKMGCGSCPDGTNLQSGMVRVKGAPTPNSNLEAKMQTQILSLTYVGGAKEVKMYVGPETGRKYRYGPGTLTRNVGYSYDFSNEASKENEVHPLDAEKMIGPLDRSGIVFELSSEPKPQVVQQPPVVEVEEEPNWDDLLKEIDKTSVKKEVSREPNPDAGVPLEVVIALDMHVDKLGTVNEIKEKYLDYAPEEVLTRWYNEEKAGKNRVTLLAAFEVAMDALREDE